MKIELTQAQVDFLNAFASVCRDKLEERLYLPFVYTKDPEDKETRVFDIEFLDIIKPKILMKMGIERVFNLEEMKDCALAMANWGEGFNNALTPTEYFKKEFDIDI